MNEQKQRAAQATDRDASLPVAPDKGTADAALPLADLAPQGDVIGAGNQGWGRWEVNPGVKTEQTRQSSIVQDL